MPIVHFLNVGEGDCSVIQHASGRVTIIDICNGKTGSESLAEGINRLSQMMTKATSSNLDTQDQTTEPIAYLKELGVSKVFRFVLTHPDMDHMDGFKALCDDIGILNFWDSGARQTKPDFAEGRYNEEDWDNYVKVRDGKARVTVVKPKAGSRFKFANLGDPDNCGDCISVVSPDNDLVMAANRTDDPNDASYVLVYRTCGGRIIFPGDAHDKTWEFVQSNCEELVKDCSVLIAPHHGRASDRSYEFLDVLEPKLSLFGCARSDEIAFDAWHSRGLLYITNNKAGNVLLRPCNQGIEVYVEDFAFAKTFNTFSPLKGLRGCFFIGLIDKN